ncbi:MAG: class I SAM-dependent methyltransferase [Proteobacteria bacterium]|nr:class I SAM-dependent methyltransferase [Pseudomonadota bacterium]
MFLLGRFLRSFIRVGSLVVVDADGNPHRFGTPGDGPDIAIRISDKRYYARLGFNPGLYLGEAYMDGALTVEHDDLIGFLDLCGRNLADRPLGSWLAMLGGLARRLTQYNPMPRSRRNVAHHYDLSAALFDSFLDPDRQYSCAYFPTQATSLDEAQAAKKRHIAAKLLLKPGMRVLDIGCGWGGLALDLARHCDVEVHGITLSREQLEVARRRAAAEGLAGRVRFSLTDYRDVAGEYDRIVSVGMFEHVGTGHYREYFGAIRRLLAPDGVALLHAIGRSDGPGVSNAWIRKYIFPGGYSPALSEVLPTIEKSGLWTTDIEILRLHYAETLRHWRERFLANWHRTDAGYDQRFRRMWEFYLAASEMSFRHDRLMVFQIQLARDVASVPVTRDYMFAEERRLAGAGAPEMRETA